MALPYWRGKQSTATTGTGTLTLDAVSGNLRGFNAAAGGASIRVRYTLAWASGFEIGYGDYDGGVPGQLTRVTVVASSNAGALVNLPAGSKDVWLQPDADVPLLAASGGLTLTLADLGNTVVFTGTASATIALPAVATVPPGSGFRIRNAGDLANGPLLTIDPNGAELVNGATTVVLAPGEGCSVFRSGSGWIADGLGTGFVPLRRIITAASQAVIDFVLPTGFDAFKLRFRKISAAAGGPDLYARVSTDGGASFVAGTGYGFGGLFLDAGAAAIGSASNVGSAVILHTAVGGTAGEITVQNARDSTTNTTIFSMTAPVRSAISHVGQVFGGQRAAAEDNNALRLLLSASNFVDGGVVSLSGER